MQVLRNSLGWSHEIIKQAVAKGDTVVDATAGNGNDTAFLASLVGEGGRVYAFDIQEQAIEKTGQKIGELGLADRVTLIKDGHQNMDLYIKEKVKAVMFNLGYLPGGDHSVGTKGETTMAAVGKAMELVAVNGIVSVVVYYGGDSGFEEKEQVMKFFEEIDRKRFNVMKVDFINQVNCPPILVCIEKLSNC